MNIELRELLKFMWHDKKVISIDVTEQWRPRVALHLTVAKWSAGSSFNPRIGGSIPASASPCRRLNGKTLNPKIGNVSYYWCAGGTLAPPISVWISVNRLKMSGTLTIRQTPTFVDTFFILGLWNCRIYDFIFSLSLYHICWIFIRKIGRSKNHTTCKPVSWHVPIHKI